MEKIKDEHHLAFERSKNFQKEIAQADSMTAKQLRAALARSNHRTISRSGENR
jgi:hypothetical protein